MLYSRSVSRRTMGGRCGTAKAQHLLLRSKVNYLASKSRIEILTARLSTSMLGHPIVQPVPQCRRRCALAPMASASRPWRNARGMIQETGLCSLEWQVQAASHDFFTKHQGTQGFAFPSSLFGHSGGSQLDANISSETRCWLAGLFSRPYARIQHCHSSKTWSM